MFKIGIVILELYLFYTHCQDRYSYTLIIPILYLSILDGYKNTTYNKKHHIIGVFCM